MCCNICNHIKHYHSWDKHIKFIKQRLHPQRMPLMLLAGGIRCELSRVGRVGGSGFRSKLPGGWHLSGHGTFALSGAGRWKHQWHPVTTFQYLRIGMGFDFGSGICNSFFPGMLGLCCFFRASSWIEQRWASQTLAAKTCPLKVHDDASGFCGETRVAKCQDQSGYMEKSADECHAWDCRSTRYMGLGQWNPQPNKGWELGNFKPPGAFSEFVNSLRGCFLILTL